MSVDFTKPVATGDRAQNLVDTKDTLVAVAKQRPDLAAGGIAADMIRWSSSGSKWEIFNGSAWADLASTFAINVSSFNGQAASYYTNIAARLGYTPVNKAGDTMTGALVLNADPSVALGAATKGYVDTGLSGKAAAAHTHAWSAITNRMYSDATDSGDPNTTTEPFMVTSHANGPLGAGTYFYIWTGWHGGGTYMAQVAVEVAAGAPRTYTRSKTSGTWYAWVRCDLGEGLTRSIGTSGYAKIPGAGGLITQWGYWTNAYTSGTVTFPVAFPSTAFAVTVVDGTYFDGGHQTYVPSINRSGFTWGRGTPVASATSYWIAVGV